MRSALGASGPAAGIGKIDLSNRPMNNVGFSRNLLIFKILLTLCLWWVCQVSTATINLINNSDFEAGRANWNFVNNFFIFTNSASALDGSQYAYVGADSGGTKANTTGGEMWQQFTIPSGATAVVCSWYYYITSDDTSATKNDYLSVTLKTTSGNLQAVLQTNYNTDRVTSKLYQQSTRWNLIPFVGQTLRLSFYGTNNGSLPTVFRIEDATIIATVPPGAFTLSAAPSCYMVGGSHSPEIFLSWTASPGATGYDIYRNGSYYTSTTTTYFDNTAVSIGSTYSYYIVANNSDGSHNSNTNTVTVPNNVCPQPPTLVSPGVASSSGVLISTLTPQFLWNSVNGATGYGVYISESPYGQANQIYSTNIFNTSTNHTVASGTLQPGTSYRWKATSFYGDIESDPGSPLYFTTDTIPASPTSLIALDYSDHVDLGWSDQSGNETGFKIERKLGNGTYSQIATVGNNVQAYTDSSVASASTYTYRVKAYNGIGDSLPSNEYTVTIPNSGPAPVAKIAANLTPVTGISTYYGRYSTGAGLSYSWHTSDGQNSSAIDPQFSFNSPGQYGVFLTVTDTAAQTSAASIQVTVQAANIGVSPSQPIGADPVVLSSGNYIQERVDLRLAGNGFPFEFKRFYNSKFSDQSGKPLGYGWTHAYNLHLQDTTTNVLVVRGDGSTWTFFQTNGGYIGEAGVFDSLTHNPDTTWALSNKNQTTTLFDSSGGLLSIIDKNGNNLSTFYTNGILRQIRDTAGRIIDFNTNTFGCISDITDPIGRIIRFRYDAQTNLIAVIDASNHTNTYSYDSFHQMTDAYDARGTRFIHNEYNSTDFTVFRQHDAFTNWTYFTYDFTNRVTYQTNALNNVSIHSYDSRLLVTNVVDEAGQRQVFAYDDSRNQTYVRDKNGNETRYSYDSAGNLTNKTDALENITVLQYDERNNPMRRVDPLSNVTTYGYDLHGNLVSVTNKLGNITRQQYNDSGLPIIVTDARGFSTTNQYDPQGNLVAIVDAQGISTLFAYDLVGRKVTQVDGLNRTNSFGYDNNDNLLYATNALGFVSAFTYDDNNNRTSSRDPRLATTTFIFDLKDRLIATVDSLNHTNATLYDALDRKVATFDALGNRTSYAYNEVGYLIAVTNALNQVTRFTCDAEGNQSGITDPTDHYTTNFFDSLNRKVATIDVSVSTNLTAYDALSRIIATTNAIGQVTHFNYDADGQLTNVIDAKNQTVFFTYDENGNRIHMTDPSGHTWTNIFDKLNRLVEQHNPDTTKTLSYYDGVGNLTNRITPNGDSIVYAYDGLRRLTNILYPVGPPVSFAYDSVGNRTNMTDNVGTTVWEFDLLNRLTSVTDPYGQTVENGFDANGNRISLTYPNAKVVNYGFDPLNRLTTLTNWLSEVVSYTYDSRGNLLTTTNANGTTTSYVYDAASRVLGLTNNTADNTLIAAYALTLDPIGNYAQAAHNQPLFPILKDRTNNYAYNADNRLAAIDGNPVIHNPNGDLTSIGTNSYVYDFENRLVGSVFTNSSNVFTYDGIGNRVARSMNGRAERFVLDRAGGLTQMLVETETNNLAIAYYVYGLGLVQRIASNGTVATYHFDTQGSTVALTDSGGNITDSYAYDSFGELANSEGNTPQPLRYLGKFGTIDDGIGLCYARARYFVPSLGRFLSKDPLTGKDSNSASLDRYVYALNNPLRFCDPSGLAAHEGRIVSQYNPYAGEAAYWQTYNEETKWMIPWLTAFKWAGDAAQVALAFVSGGESTVATRSIEGVVEGGAEFKAIGSTGKIGENTLKTFGGEPQVYFPTSQGGRYVDQLINGVANESKVGYQSLTANINLQISKDVELIQSGKIQDAVWHFFESPVTGEIGPSQPLLNTLQDSGIKVIIH
jgi:RHS repeat-associated protein